MKILKKQVGMYTDTLGRIKVTEPCIYLHRESNPIGQQRYRAVEKSHRTLEQHIRPQLDAGIIDSAQHGRLFPKKEGTMPFCVDFCRLNTSTTVYTKHLSRMEEFIGSLGDAIIFSGIDALWGY